MTQNRQENAYRTRVSAAAKARDRVHPIHRANGDEQRFANSNYAMSFTKGLKHDPNTGLLDNRMDFVAFRRAIDDGFIDPFTSHVQTSPEKKRAWEAPTAGVVFELEGPDPQAVTMAPAPAFGSDELSYEMAEVYELALLRDAPLSDFTTGTNSPAVVAALERLEKMPYAQDGYPERPRKLLTNKVTPQTLFRGSSPGVETGPYLSQFMVLGNDQPTNAGVAHGFIQYGALQVNQRVPVATPQNYLTKWADWLEAQNGADLRDNRSLFDCDAPRRFIVSPRDLATYVHDDALYEAYLNACLILLSMGAPFDPSFDHLSGQGQLFLNSLNTNCQTPLETHTRQAGGFALYGGPHILTLVTEVATRALKAVRFQKFNTHIRLRPEALAGRIECASQIESKFGHVGNAFSSFAESLSSTVGAVRESNDSKTALLPMAFQEGSPMHPSYGAGHATVAGACITILKAFFDTNSVLVHRKGGGTFALHQKGDTSVQYEPDSAGVELVPTKGKEFLTLEGELNKLAANISIARNMAGVHYFSDYYDSLRMGEQIALGILEEQALGYPTDSFVLTVPTFDGDVVRIGAR